jgi:membrane-associated phospholipid phosphatase
VALWIVLATTVSTSRFHVRIHHATDVVAGAVVGVALALAMLPVL